MNSIDTSRFQPLNSLRILVTRAESSRDKLTMLLRNAGATPIEYPTIAFAAPTKEQGVLLDTALHAACTGAYDWLLLTSITGVRFVAERLAVLGLRPDKLRGLQVGAVGLASARSPSGEGELSTSIFAPDVSHYPGAACSGVVVWPQSWRFKLRR